MVCPSQIRRIPAPHLHFSLKLRPRCWWAFLREDREKFCLAGICEPFMRVFRIQIFSALRRLLNFLFIAFCFLALSRIERCRVCLPGSTTVQGVVAAKILARHARIWQGQGD